MQVGFLALEVGTVRAKNVKAALFKSMIDHSIVAICWFCIGFSIFSGSNMFASGPDTYWFFHPDSDFARLFQQYAFAVTTVMIVSGAVISRIRLWIYLFFSGMLTIYIYPVVAHWAWNPYGWLYVMGFKDFSGSSVVHVVGGFSALVGAMACGPRVGRFGDPGEGGSENSRMERRGSEDGSEASFGHFHPEEPHDICRHRLVKRLCCNSTFCRKIVDILSLHSPVPFRVREQLGHSTQLQCLGALLIYVSSFSFNTSSSLGLDTVDKAYSAARAAVNTMLSAAAGSICALLWSTFFRKSYDVNLIVNGLLSSLVVINSGCGYIDNWAAIVVGLISVPVYVYFSRVVLYIFHIDDPLDSFAVHGACGIIGTIWTGFTDSEAGLFHTGDASLLGVQILGSFAIAGWTLVNAFIQFYGLKYILLPCFSRCCHRKNNDVADEYEDDFGYSIVYSTDAQLVGLDFFYFGGSGFPDFDVEAVSEYNATQRIKQRFKAKRMGSMNMFDRDVSELSTHMKHVSTVNNHVTPTSVFGHLRENVSNNRRLSEQNMTGMGNKRTSEQVMVVDSFIVSNPQRTSKDSDD